MVCECEHGPGLGRQCAAFTRGAARLSEAGTAESRRKEVVVDAIGMYNSPVGGVDFTASSLGWSKRFEIEWSVNGGG